MKCYHCKKEFGNKTEHVIFNSMPNRKDLWFCSEKCLMTYYD
jgi:hypothetical protein